MAASLVAQAAGCGPLTPVPPLGPHAEQGDSFLQVPRMPGPVRMEKLEPAPRDGAVWIDGYWNWSGRRWVWRPGVWALRPTGAYYAAPEIVRLPVPVYAHTGKDRHLRGYDMALLYRPGHWHLPDGSIVPVTPIAFAASR